MALCALRLFSKRNTVLVNLSQQCGLKTKATGLINYDIPYEDFVTKKWPIHRFCDRTRWKLNENSKALAVEGGIAVGKGKFAKHLANEFELKYIDDTCDDDFWINNNNDPPIDYREYNDILPKNLQFYTVPKFYMDPDPRNNGRPIHLQHNFYLYRHWYYLYGLASLFNTGHGIVSNNSPFSSIVFAQTMYDMGLCSKEAFDWLNYIHKNVIHYLAFPHLVVYLKGSVKKSRQAIQERNNPWEINSPWFTDKFLEAYKNIMETDYLTKMSKFGEVIELDLNALDLDRPEDAAFVVEEISKLDLELSSVDQHDVKYGQWRTFFHKPDAQDFFRFQFSDAKAEMEHVYRLFPPREMRECTYNIKETAIIRELMSMDERNNTVVAGKNFLADVPKQYTIFKSDPRNV